MKTTFLQFCRRLFPVLLLIGWSSPGGAHAALVAAWGGPSQQQTLLPNGLTDIKAIGAGVNHSLAVRADGRVVGWGLNFNGQASPPPGLANVIRVAGGQSHSLALQADGAVVGWGANDYGQTQFPAGLSGVRAIATGSFHNLALKADGTVIAWGQNFLGQTNVPGNCTNIVAVAAAGGDHSLALRADGTVIAWGDNDFGQTNVPPGLSNIVGIAAGHDHSLALQANGRVVAWGRDSFGEIRVPANASNVIAIAAGEASSLALKADGTVVAWGYNGLGGTNIPVGLSNVTAIASGWFHHLALVSAGPIQLIQEPQSQSVPYTSNATFSVVASGQEPLTYQWYRDGQLVVNMPRIAGATTATLNLANVQFSDIGNYHVVVSNALGSVASAAATLTVVSPPFITQQPGSSTYPAGAQVVIPAAASGTPPLFYQWRRNGTNMPGATSASLFLPNAQPADSGVYILRVTNNYGFTETLPVTITVTSRAPYILNGGPFIYRNSTNAVLPPDGSATIEVLARGTEPLSYQWRLNGGNLPGATNATLNLANLRYDQAGYYSVEVRNAVGVTNSPKVWLNVSQVLLAGAPFAGNTNLPLALSDVTALAAGGSHIMALKTDGTVRTWLANANYIFGGARAVTNVPASATNVVAIAAGYDHCVALRSNGTVVAWGGEGLHTNVPVGLSNVVSIAAGWSRSYAVKADGTVTGWGSSATPPAGLSNVVAMAASSLQNLALRRDGTVALWTGTGSFSVVPGLSNAIAVAASASANRALRADGRVVNWAATTPTLPTLVFEGNQLVSNAVAIALGSSGTSLVLKQNGALVGEPASAMPTNLNAIAAGGVQTGFSAYLLGAGEPAFTLQPVSQTVTKSNTVSLHARSVGALPQPLSKPTGPPALRPPHYQWQRDGVNLLGATNASLILSNVLGRDTGDYRLIASNSLGLAPSRVATVALHFNTNLPAALNATNLTWTTYGGAKTTGWFAQNRETHDGDVAAQSGAIFHQQQSTLQTIVTGPGTLSFWWKVSSEAGYDFLRFYSNNVATPHASISGETEWQRITVALAAGTHTLRWEYSKDGSVIGGRDAGWVDEVMFSGPVPEMVRHPFDKTVVAGTTVTIPAYVTSPTSMTFQWLKNGTNLPGANAMYLTLPNVSSADSGGYALRTSNQGGSVTSSNATLTVIAPLQLGAPQQQDNGMVQLVSRCADGTALHPYELALFAAQASTNLVHWEILPGALSLTNGALLLRDTNAALHPRRFYRIREH